MRPAQKAPENSAAVRLIGVAFVRFNEAGAKSAGKPSRNQLMRERREWASMRPAQKAPENQQWLQ